MGKDPFPFDLLYWNSDSTRMPYAMHSFYLRNMYLGNKLREPGGIEIAGVSIDISKVKTPCYFISTVEDHIARGRAPTRAPTCLRPGQVRARRLGHIAGIVNPPAANKYGYWTNDALPEDADDFLRGRHPESGLVVVDWQQWLPRRPMATRRCRPAPGDGPLKVLEDAPGSYVKFRLDAQKKAK